MCYTNPFLGNFLIGYVIPFLLALLFCELIYIVLIRTSEGKLARKVDSFKRLEAAVKEFNKATTDKKRR